MRYVQTGESIEVGDAVMVEGNVEGLVVCDYDKRTCLAGYEGWLTTDELVGGGTLSSGIMVKTDELGLVHYEEEDASIFKAKHEKVSKPSD